LENNEIMVQIEETEHKIEITIQAYEKVYIAWIKGADYMGIVVEATSIGECITELGISLVSLEKYRKNLKTQPGKVSAERP
jgi:hypothetical protein